jgi:hypothetical protein
MTTKANNSAGRTELPLTKASDQPQRFRDSSTASTKAEFKKHQTIPLTLSANLTSTKEIYP